MTLKGAWVTNGSVGFLLSDRIIKPTSSALQPIEGKAGFSIQSTGLRLPMLIRTRRTRIVLTLASILVFILPAHLRAYTHSGPFDARALLLGDEAIINRAAYSVRLPYTQITFLRVSHPKVRRFGSSALACPSTIGLSTRHRAPQRDHRDTR